ncbi:MAG: hypothetical protein FJ014_14590, partial [Chloroflexi bacterium]|nr:hypothetical protein [Chloroflexota bacterium]
METKVKVTTQAVIASKAKQSPSRKEEIASSQKALLAMTRAEQLQVKIGIIGTGDIFQAYVKGCRVFDVLDIAACADIDRRKAEAKAEEFSVLR